MMTNTDDANREACIDEDSVRSAWQSPSFSTFTPADIEDVVVVGGSIRG